MAPLHHTLNRVVVIGIDGFSPSYMDKFVAERSLPSIARLADVGVCVPVISTLPASTPVAWASMATGAPPSVTGIEGFLLHLPGNRFDQRVSGCYAHRCRAQPLWEAATEQGRRAHVIKFPLSYPSSAATFRLDGAAGWGGVHCLHEAAVASVASTHDDDGPPAIVERQLSWSHEAAGPNQHVWTGVWHIPSLWRETPIQLHVAVTRSAGGVVAVEVADRPDRKSVLVTLSCGEWSQPLTIRGAGRRGVAELSFRVKVLGCSADPPSLHLMNTALHERYGHSHPEAVWDRYITEAGPIEEETEPSLFLNGRIDLETQFELFELNATWLQRVTRSALRRRECDFLMAQIHIVDWAHHMLHWALDPRHPDYRAEQAGHYEGVLLRAYQMADALVSAASEELGPDDVLIVMGDHGQDVQHTTFRVNEWLAAEGYLRWAGDDGAVDWDHTRVYATGNYVYVNQQGRDPAGIVPAALAERLRREVLDRLRHFTDPVRRWRPILIAGEKQKFGHLGADGMGVGDIIYCMQPGYHATNGTGPLLSKNRLFREFTSGHDHFWPLHPSIQTRLYAVGGDLRAGYRRAESAQMVDVAPTIARLLSIRPPAHSRGQVVSDIFEHPVPSSTKRCPVSAAAGEPAQSIS